MDLQKILAQVSKAISAGTTMGGAAGLSTNVLVRENLSGYITDLARKQTNVRDRLTRKSGSGIAASWNTMTGLTYGNSATVEGQAPAEDDATYVRRLAPYKILGKTKTITFLAQSAGASFTDEEAHQTENAMTEVVTDEEIMILQGDATGTPTEFDGLESLVTTNVKDDNNSMLGFRTDLVDEAVETQQSLYNVMPTAVYSGFGGRRAINQSLQNTITVQAAPQVNVSAGANIGSIQTINGVLPVVPTIGITGDSVNFPGSTVEDMYVVVETLGSEDVLYMEDLTPISKVDLARTGLADKFAVYEETVFVCRAEEFQFKIENIHIK